MVLEMFSKQDKLKNVYIKNFFNINISLYINYAYRLFRYIPKK